MIGTTRSRVSFFMNRFRDLGFIEYNGAHARPQLTGLRRSPRLALPVALRFSHASSNSVRPIACRSTSQKSANPAWTPRTSLVREADPDRGRRK